MWAERRRYDAVKRGLDVTVSAVGLVVSAPVQLVTAGVVLYAHGRPVLFRQLRPGRDGVVFELVKFRTMRHPDGASPPWVGSFAPPASTSCRPCGMCSRVT